MQAADGEAGDSSGDRDPEEAEEPEEDPEVVALKEEIGKLEGELKGKKSSLAYALDQVDEYSKAGYARAVAEMENMRRVRSVGDTWVVYSFSFGESTHHSLLLRCII